jgi:ABC-2 type transport system permease protein
MNTVTMRAGLERGRIELRQNLTNGQELWGVLFFPVLGFIVMYFLRGSTVPGTSFSLGTQAVPGILAMTAAFNGMTALAMTMTMDREDGTLLRLKATPHGVPGYLAGKVISRAGTTVVGLLVPMLAAALLFDGLQVSWLTLLWVLALGLVALLPLGAIMGSLANSTQGLSIVTLPIMVLMAISGLFYPITGFPDWLQSIAQVFPLYWLGLGLRSALLPDSVAVAEIGESWRHLETIGVLGAWAVIGLLLAPPVLRRMARRESGSAVAARQEKAMQRLDVRQR